MSTPRAVQRQAPLERVPLGELPLSSFLVDAALASLTPSKSRSVTPSALIPRTRSQSRSPSKSPSKRLAANHGNAPSPSPLLVSAMTPKKSRRTVQQALRESDAENVSNTVTSSCDGSVTGLGVCVSPSNVKRHAVGGSTSTASPVTTCCTTTPARTTQSTSIVAAPFKRPSMPFSTSSATPVAPFPSAIEGGLFDASNSSTILASPARRLFESPNGTAVALEDSPKIPGRATPGANGTRPRSSSRSTPRSSTARANRILGVPSTAKALQDMAGGGVAVCKSTSITAITKGRASNDSNTGATLQGAFGSSNPSAKLNGAWFDEELKDTVAIQSQSGSTSTSTSTSTSGDKAASPLASNGPGPLPLPRLTRLPNLTPSGNEVTPPLPSTEWVSSAHAKALQSLPRKRERVGGDEMERGDGGRGGGGGGGTGGEEERDKRRGKTMLDFGVGLGAGPGDRRAGSPGFGPRRGEDGSIRQGERGGEGEEEEKGNEAEAHRTLSLDRALPLPLSDLGLDGRQAARAAGRCYGALTSTSSLKMEGMLKEEEDFVIFEDPQEIKEGMMRGGKEGMGKGKKRWLNEDGEGEGEGEVEMGEEDEQENLPPAKPVHSTSTSTSASASVDFTPLRDMKLKQRVKMNHAQMQDGEKGDEQSQRKSQSQSQKLKRRKGTGGRLSLVADANEAELGQSESVAEAEAESQAQAKEDEGMERES